MPLDDFYKKIVVLEEFDIVKETIEIINNNSSYLADLLAIQLSKGKDGNNENVTIFGRDYYKDKTVFSKEHFGVGLGKVTDYVTNYMTGSFYKELFVKTEGQNFYMESNVPYFDQIIRQSGEVIMELNEEHLSLFNENILIPQLQNKFSSLWNGV